MYYSSAAFGVAILEWAEVMIFAPKSYRLTLSTYVFVCVTNISAFLGLAAWFKGGGDLVTIWSTSSVSWIAYKIPVIIWLRRFGRWWSARRGSLPDRASECGAVHGTARAHDDRRARRERHCSHDKSG